MPEHVSACGIEVQHGDGSGRKAHTRHNAILILQFRIRTTLRRNERRGDNQRVGSTHGNHANSHRLAGVLLGDVVDAVHALDGERIAGSKVGIARNRDGLEAVVNVVGFAGNSGRGSARHVVVERSRTGVNRAGGRNSGAGETETRIGLIRVKAGNHANAGAVVGGLRLAGHEVLAVGQVASHAVVVARVEHDLAVFHRNAAFVHRRIAQRHVIKRAGCGRASDHQTTIDGGSLIERGVHVRSKPLGSRSAKAVFLQRIAQFLGIQRERHVLGETKGGRHAKLRHVTRSHGRTKHAVLRRCDVGHRTPDHVIGAFHSGIARAIHVDELGDNQRVIEASEHVLKRDHFFL